eukprot:m.63798 g.63798  ORF g.63798 m.63798 type:complete len:104 (-) comp11966_c0_seq2:177-488(-)
MPIQVKDYTWNQTGTHVFVTVPLKGMKKEKADIYTTDVYIKVNFPPFVFEVDLLHAVDDEQSKATIQGGTITFELLKKEETQWEELCFDGYSTTLEWAVTIVM